MAHVLDPLIDEQVTATNRKDSSKVIKGILVGPVAKTTRWRIHVHGDKPGKDPTARQFHPDEWNVVKDAPPLGTTTVSWNKDPSS